MIDYLFALFALPMARELAAKLLLVFAITWLVSRVGRGLGPTFVARVWQLGLVAMAALPVLTWLLPSWELAILPAIKAVPQPGPVMPVEQLASGDPAYVLITGLAYIYFLLCLPLLARLYARHRQLLHIEIHSSAVADAGLLRLLGRRCKQLRISQLPRLCRHAGVGTPMTWGLGPAYIVLPQHGDQSGADESALLHELNHIKRGDWLWLQFANLACALQWANPMLWIARRKMVEASELACDSNVIDQGISPSQYASALLYFFNRSDNAGDPAAAVAMARPSATFARLNQILSNQPRRNNMKQWQSILLSTIGSTLLLAISACQITPANATDQVVAATTPVPSTSPNPQPDVMIAPRAARAVPYAVAARVAPEPDTFRVNPSAAPEPRRPPMPEGAISEDQRRAFKIARRELREAKRQLAQQKREMRDEIAAEIREAKREMGRAKAELSAAKEEASRGLAEARQELAERDQELRTEMRTMKQELSRARDEMQREMQVARESLRQAKREIAREAQRREAHQAEQSRKPRTSN